MQTINDVGSYLISKMNICSLLAVYVLIKVDKLCAKVSCNESGNLRLLETCTKVNIIAR